MSPGSGPARLTREDRMHVGPIEGGELVVEERQVFTGGDVAVEKEEGIARVIVGFVEAPEFVPCQIADAVGVAAGFEYWPILTIASISSSVNDMTILAPQYPSRSVQRSKAGFG